MTVSELATMELKESHAEARSTRRWVSPVSYSNSGEYFVSISRFFLM